MAEASPMIKQYLSIKEKYPDCILFYRLGDFYEMFFEDAVECARVLDLTLTGKDCGTDERAPMCGIPYHSASTYITKLIEMNYKVAICEQLSAPVKGQVVQRDVVRIITPGTIFDDTMLENKKNNYIASIFKQDKKIGLTYCDITTGRFNVCELKGEDLLNQLNDILVRILPSEVICNQEANEIINSLQIYKLNNLHSVSCYKEYFYEYETALKTLKQQFGANFLSIYEIKNMDTIVSASGALIEYIKETQKRSLVHINRINKETISNYMILDINTRRNLELTETIKDRKKKGSILWLLDDTKTSMGGRMLRTWLEQPLKNRKEINNRLNSVEELYSKIILRDKINNTLSKIYDIERLAGKVSFGTVNAKDCLAIYNSLSYIPELKQELAQLNSSKFVDFSSKLPIFDKLTTLLEQSIDPECSANMKDGGYIKKGFNTQLDEYREAKNDGKNWIIKLEAKEREVTGIKNLKINYNKVFGYYIEVTNSFLGSVPLRYVRKQTLVNNERFITEELKDLEDKILNATENSIKLEQEIFNKIKEELFNYLSDIQLTANIIAETDCLLTFAKLAIKNNYCKPIILNSNEELEIIEGRHPVVEAVLKNDQFISNDTKLNLTTDNVMIITGPNMAGKSTYMRQVAVITLLAHIGCFVPAKSARIPITDRIFTRVGASDDLAFGQSTFMVEMSEVANIIHNATTESLIILDEIGRGTSTFDGLSIAWSVVEYLCKKLKAKTLFATHYHELTELEGFLEGVKNYKVSIKEFNNSIIFLRKIVRGGANKSFGIEVAAMAGIPNIIIDRAREISKTLEENDLNKNFSLNSTEDKVENLKLNKTYLEVINILKDINIERLTPLDSFDMLNSLINKIK